MRDEIFSKFKDYNKELEKILEKKDFEEDTKNLLLSMFYKLETSYNDYYTVKRKSRTKQEYLENILENIRHCYQIQMIKPSSQEFNYLKENGLYEIDIKLGKIKVIANETALLSAIMELNNFQIRLNENYNLIRNAMPYLLNMAYEMENIEVLRDFNAWSWNTLTKEIKDIRINLVYQILKIVLNFEVDVFYAIQQNTEYQDVMEFITEQLNKQYDEKKVAQFLEIISKIAIAISITISDNERKRLQEEKEIIEQELQEINNKKSYITKITEEKKNLKKQLKQIDLVISNKMLLLEEFARRNENLMEYEQIFSISHLVEKMQKERKKLLEKMDRCNQKMDPKTYIQNKHFLQKEFHLLEDISFQEENDIYGYIDKLQVLFLREFFPKKIEQAENKNELIDLVYELRYYLFLPYSKDQTIQDRTQIQKDIQKNMNSLLKKLYEKKILSNFSNNMLKDIEILYNLFTIRMINLEDSYLQIKKRKETLEVTIFDEKDTLEKTIEMHLDYNPKEKIKYNKKIKVFL